jgi:hypothetical protein
VKPREPIIINESMIFMIRREGKCMRKPHFLIAQGACSEQKEKERLFSCTIQQDIHMPCLIKTDGCIMLCGSGEQQSEGVKKGWRPSRDA